MAVGFLIAQCGVTILGREEVLFFYFERFGEVLQERLQGGVEGQVEEDDEDEEDDHKDDGAGCGFDAEKADQADDGEVTTCRGLLQGARVDETFCIDPRMDNEEKVVSVGKVDKVQANGCESHDKRCNDRVRYGC